MSLVLNIRTVRFYPQYHGVFDNNLSTVEHMRKGIVPENWKKMIEEHSDIYIQENFKL